MQVHVKLSSTLRQHVPGYEPEKGLDLELVSAKSAADIATQLGLPIPEIKFIMLNGRCQNLATLVQNGDRLAFFPAVGGG